MVSFCACHEYWICCVLLIAAFLCVDYGSEYLGRNNGHHVLRVLLDSSCHAVIAGLIWFSARSLSIPRVSAEKYRPKPFLSVDFSVPTFDRGWLSQNRENILATVFGSMVDIDHFVAAGSLSLSAATNLPSRPWGHCLFTGLIVSVALGAVSWLAGMIDKPKNNCKPSEPARFSQHWPARVTLLIFTSYLAHLLRDAVRRGLWIVSLPSSWISSAPDKSEHLYLTLSTPPIARWVVLSMYCLMPVVVSAMLQQLEPVRLQAESDGQDEKDVV
jgi:hypothetical protein